LTVFPPPNDSVLKAAWVKRAPVPEVAGWLASVRADDSQSSFADLFPQGLLRAVVAREDPFLDLAVALHGDDPEVLKALWSRGDAEIRRAVLMNQNRDRGFRI
jgi:hypothetical protein